MLKRLPDGRLYDGPADRQGAETAVKAQARELVSLVKTIRDESPSEENRILADAILFLAAYVNNNL